MKKPNKLYVCIILVIVISLSFSVVAFAASFSTPFMYTLTMSLGTHSAEDTVGVHISSCRLSDDSEATVEGYFVQSGQRVSDKYIISSGDTVEYTLSVLYGIGDGARRN